MRIKTKVLGTVVAGLLAAAGLAYADGIFPGFPQVPSGAATTLSGAETTVMDTHLASGAAPQSITINSNQLGTGARTVVAVSATGFSVTIPANKPIYIVNTAACTNSICATGTITMPASPNDGYMQRIISTGTNGGTVTTLTLSGNTGQTVDTAPTALTESKTGAFGYAFVYDSAAATWYRFQ